MKINQNMVRREVLTAKQLLTRVHLCAAQGLHPNKRKIETKYKLAQLNWVTIPATQISSTVFNRLDDETILKELDFTDFEETFKTKAQSSTLYMIIIPYSRVIGRISPISTYPLLGGGFCL